jgi:hypothetical protein
LFKNEVNGFKLVLMVKIVIENLAQKELAPVDPSKSILQVVQLSQLTPAELKYRSLGQLAENERLACQTRALGSCRILIPEESKMPHMHYTS